MTTFERRVRRLAPGGGGMRLGMTRVSQIGNKGEGNCAQIWSLPYSYFTFSCSKQQMLSHGGLSAEASAFTYLSAKPFSASDVILAPVALR